MKNSNAGRNGFDARLEKVLKLAEENERRWAQNEQRSALNEQRSALNEKRWALNEKRWALNERRWQKLGEYIRQNERRHAAHEKRFEETLALCWHTLRNFRRWIREQA